MNKKIFQKIINKNINFILYATIGITGVFLDLLIFFILHAQLKLNQYLSNFVSISAGITNNFFLNRSFNFKKRDKTLKRYFYFYTIGIFGLLVSSALIFFLTEIVKIDSTISKITSIPIVTSLQFILNKYITFKKFDETS